LRRLEHNASFPCLARVPAGVSDQTTARALGLTPLDKAAPALASFGGRTNVQTVSQFDVLLYVPPASSAGEARHGWSVRASARAPHRPALAGASPSS